MLDSFGPTLTHTSVNSFFIRYNKKPDEDELTVAEAIQRRRSRLHRLLARLDICSICCI